MAPIITERDRNECETIQTIKDFFIYTYAQEMAEGALEDSVFNTNEIFAEIGVPTNIFAPPNKKRRLYINEFDQNYHCNYYN